MDLEDGVESLRIGEVEIDSKCHETFPCIRFERESRRASAAMRLLERAPGGIVERAGDIQIVIALETPQRARRARPRAAVDRAAIIPEIAQPGLRSGDAAIGRVVERIQLADAQVPREVPTMILPVRASIGMASDLDGPLGLALLALVLLSALHFELEVSARICGSRKWNIVAVPLLGSVTECPSGNLTFGTATFGTASVLLVFSSLLAATLLPCDMFLFPFPRASRKLVFFGSPWWRLWRGAVEVKL